MMSEVAHWLARIAGFLPELIGLWEAAKVPNPQQQLDASLALVRKMQDVRAREEIAGP